MSPTLRRLLAPALVLVVGALALVALLGSSDPEPEPVVVDLASIESGELRDFGPAPATTDDPWTQETVDSFQQITASLVLDAVPVAQISELGRSGDPRLAWPLADLLRFVGPGEATDSVVGAINELVPEIEVDPFGPWGSTVDHLLAWDLPAPPQYFEIKQNLYRQVEPKWGELFEADADIDWRLVGWGGVGIDDREFGSADPCRCIPALDEPVVTPAAEGDWYPDEAIVFGVVIDGEARAYPKNIMEVHEMVNDTIGGRDMAIPYCTLCGSAQVYFTDGLPAELDEEFGRPVLRTSGLLIRSNKMMYERQTADRSSTPSSAIATSPDPWPRAGIVVRAGLGGDHHLGRLEGLPSRHHRSSPRTAASAGSTTSNPLGGRDDNGPIFPIGEVDPRLPVQEPILGLITDDGRCRSPCTSGPRSAC